MQEGEESELVCKAASGDIEAKLQLVKKHLNLVVEIAAMYASKTGRTFPQMVQVGALVIIKAANSFHHSQQIGFADHLKSEITRAMEGIS